MDLPELQTRVDKYVRLDLAPLFDAYVAQGGGKDIEGFLAFLASSRIVDASLLKELHGMTDVEVPAVTDPAFGGTMLQQWASTHGSATEVDAAPPVHAPDAPKQAAPAHEVRFAPVTITLTGTPFASTRTWCLDPGRARSVGFGPVFGPPQRLARTMNRPLHMRNRAGQIRAACRAVARAACPTPRSAASRATDASKSLQSRSPTGSADGSIASLSSARAGCH